MNSYSQIYIMVVFAVKHREAMLGKESRPLIYKAIRTIVADHGEGSVVIDINGTGDHIHILLGLSTNISISTIVREIKSRSSRWINEQNLTKNHFEWQRGYGAFSYSQSALPNVRTYITNQEEHHTKHSYREEFEGLLIKFGIDYDPRDIPNNL